MALEWSDRERHGPVCYGLVRVSNDRFGMASYGMDRFGVELDAVARQATDWSGSMRKCSVWHGALIRPVWVGQSSVRCGSVRRGGLRLC